MGVVPSENMSNYIRFFHVETHRFTFLEIEALVTLLILLVFVLLPLRYLAFYPPRGFSSVCAKAFPRLCHCLLLIVLWQDRAVTDRAVYRSQHP